MLLADECPKFVQLESAGADADHAAIMKLGAAFADLECQARHGFAVHASKPRGGTLAGALTESGDDLDLFVARKNVHDGQIRHVPDTEPEEWKGGKNGD